MLQLAPHPASIADVGGSIRASSACSQDQVFTVPVGRVNAAFVPFARPSLRALVVGRSNRRRVAAAVELSLLEIIALVPCPLHVCWCRGGAAPSPHWCSCAATAGLIAPYGRRRRALPSEFRWDVVACHRCGRRCRAIEGRGEMKAKAFDFIRSRARIRANSLGAPRALSAGRCDDLGPMILALSAITLQSHCARNIRMRWARAARGAVIVPSPPTTRPRAATRNQLIPALVLGHHLLQHKDGG